uniref:Uncharacterized protein n=1 Tax=Aquilaria malaccensis TaxID=223753 RepID=A0A4Y6GN15_9ROSI|nr:hypothetical protein [Aquilaria malaccensis]
MQLKLYHNCISVAKYQPIAFQLINTITKMQLKLYYDCISITK